MSQYIRVTADEVSTPALINIIVPRMGQTAGRLRITPNAAILLSSIDLISVFQLIVFHISLPQPTVTVLVHSQHSHQGCFLLQQTDVQQQQQYTHTQTVI